MLIRRLLLVGLVLGGCTDKPESVPPPPSIVASTPTPRPVSPTPAASRPVRFADENVRELYWKAGTGSCVRYAPPSSSRPVYYDRYPRLELVACKSGRATHKVVSRARKLVVCAAGQARYTLGPSYQTVMTLCLRSLVRPTVSYPPGIGPADK